MSDFSWSIDSALYQLEHGESGHDRTWSAADYLTAELKAGGPASVVIGLNLLTMVERLRSTD